MTPRKFCALVDCQHEYDRLRHGDKSGTKNKAKGNVSEGFIDQISGW